jgi:hypothetical protein
MMLLAEPAAAPTIMEALPRNRVDFIPSTEAQADCADLDQSTVCAHPASSPPTASGGGGLGRQAGSRSARAVKTLAVQEGAVIYFGTSRGSAPTSTGARPGRLPTTPVPLRRRLLLWTTSAKWSRVLGASRRRRRSAKPVKRWLGLRGIGAA